LDRFSEEYETFTEKFRRNRKGYKIDSDGLIRTKTAPVLNYNQMIDLFLSKDLTLLEIHKDIFDS
jgi:hypothetical protein